MPLTPRSEPTDERSRQRRLRGSASGRRASGRSVFGRRAFGRRGLGLVGVAALLVTAVGAPSIAATGTLTYSCTTAIGNKDMATTYDTDVPSVMHVGDPAVTIKVTENVTTDASLIGQAYTFLGARTSEASTSPSISLNGTATTVNMVAPLTPINSGQPLVSSYVGTWGTFTPTTPGTYTFVAPTSTTTHSILHKSDGSVANAADSTCTIAASTDRTIDTFTVLAKTVTATATTTSLTLPSGPTYPSDTATITANVAATGGANPTGKVNFTVNGATYSGTVSNGVATATLPALAAGDYPVTAAFVPADTTFNASTATAKTLTVSPAVVANSPSLALTKIATLNDTDGDHKADLGETITYTFNAQNTGTAAATSVALEDPTLTAASISTSCPATTLAAGASMTCTASGPYAVTSADVAAGSVANTATLSGAGTGSATAHTSTPTDATVVPVGPDGLTLTGTSHLVDTDGNGLGDAGEQVTYSYTATNTGSTTLTSVSLDAPALAAAGLTVSCSSATLAPGASTTCAASGPSLITQAVVDGGTLAVTATASGKNPAAAPVTSAPVRISTPLDQSATVSLIKKVTATGDVNGNGIKDNGDTISYGFTVTNTGAVTLTGVSVSDPLLAGVTCPAGALAPGSSVTCTASPLVITSAQVETGAVTNTATATAQPPTGAITSSAPSTTVTPLDRTGVLVVTAKVASQSDVNHNTRTDAGDSVQYAVSVTNTGSAPITGLSVVSTLGSLNVSCPTATLASGATEICTAAPYTITATDVASGHVTNVVNASATDAGSAAVRGSATVLLAISNEVTVPTGPGPVTQPTPTPTAPPTATAPPTTTPPVVTTPTTPNLPTTTTPTVTLPNTGGPSKLVLRLGLGLFGGGAWVLFATRRRRHA
jgi:uncharacterized repeat protein (TIGR01451 family)